MRILRNLVALIGGPVLFVAVASAAGQVVAGWLGTQADPAYTPGASRYGGGGWSVPLKSNAPLQWYTRALREEVAQGAPVYAPEGAPAPPADAGIRPGSWMVEPYACTLGYVFKRGNALAISTAGHCVDAPGQRVVVLTRVPGSQDPVLIDIGEVIERHADGIGDDFALIALRPPLYSWVNPAAAVVGGPCGPFASAGNHTVVYYGHGVGLKGGEPQSGAAARWRSDAFGWSAYSEQDASLSGDSGSPVRLTDFSAAGLLTHVVLDGDGRVAFVAGTRVAHIVEAAPGWSLVNSRSCVVGGGST